MQFTPARAHGYPEMGFAPVGQSDAGSQTALRCDPGAVSCAWSLATMVIARQNHGVPRRARPMGPPAGFLHRFRWNPVKRRPRLSGHSAFGETTRLGARLGRARGVGLVRRKFGAVLCRTERRRALDENRSSGKPASPISLLVQPVW